MRNIITVPKVAFSGIDGTGNRPETISAWYQVIEERETEFVIEILEE